jgi:malonate transporter
MLTVVTAFTPIWIIGALGWLTGRFRVASGQFQQALTGFTFTIAMPAVLFTTLSRTPLSQIQPRPLLAFAISTVLVGVLALVTLRGKLPDRVIGAMSSAYVNAGNLGIPIGLYVLHDATFVVSVLSFQVLVMSPLIFLGLGVERCTSRATRCSRPSCSPGCPPRRTPTSTPPNTGGPPSCPATPSWSPASCRWPPSR